MVPHQGAYFARYCSNCKEVTPHRQTCAGGTCRMCGQITDPSGIPCLIVLAIIALGGLAVHFLLRQ